MTPAWIDTSSAETGSSSTSSLRLQRERAGDADALALAAGELVRVPVAVLGVQPDLREQVADLLAAARWSPRYMPWMRSGSAMMLVDRASAGRARRTGPGRRSACRGAAGASACADSLVRSLALRTSPRRPWPASRLSTARPVVVLPQPDSPTSRASRRRRCRRRRRRPRARRRPCGGPGRLERIGKCLTRLRTDSTGSPRRRVPTSWRRAVPRRVVRPSARRAVVARRPPCRRSRGLGRRRRAEQVLRLGVLGALVAEVARRRVAGRSSSGQQFGLLAVAHVARRSGSAA